MVPDYSQFYARFHAEDPRHRHGIFLLNRRMFGPHLPADRSTPVLDVGCGRGYALQDLAVMGFTNLQGIDTDAGQITFARQLGLHVEQVADSAAFLATKPNAYGVILLMDVLEHLPRDTQPGLLRAIAGSLRPGGRLICSVPNAASAIASYWLHNDPTHHSTFTADQLGFKLEEAGLRLVHAGGVEFALRPRFLFWLPTPRTIAWWLRCLVRFRQRAVFIAELGWQRGRDIVLTPNLLLVAQKPE